MEKEVVEQIGHGHRDVDEHTTHGRCGVFHAIRHQRLHYEVCYPDCHQKHQQAPIVISF